MSKKITIIAGPNGAGKTTFAREFLPVEAGCLRFINADLIAAGLSPFAPDLVAIKAGRLMLDEIDECVQQGVNFAVETTLAARSYVHQIERWRMAGYRVTLFFLSVADPAISIQRVAHRVSQGGHHIPTDVIRRRFAAGAANFEKVYQARVCSWAHFDTSPVQPVLLAAYNPTDDPLISGSAPAIQRAARRARAIAHESKTAITVTEAGQIVRLEGEDIISLDANSFDNHADADLKQIRNDKVMATYFITFSTYGTWLHGSDKGIGSVDPSHNTYGTPFIAPNKDREQQASERMSAPPFFLDESARQITRDAILGLCREKSWVLLALHVRSNHVHVVLAADRDPGRLMSDLKARASRELNVAESRLKEGNLTSTPPKRWTRHGSTRYLFDEDSIAAACEYVLNQQGERMAYFDPREKKSTA